MTTAPIGRWRRFASWYRGDRAALAVATMLSVLQAVLLVPVAALVKLGLERGVPAGQLSYLMRCGAGILALQVTSIAVALASRHLALAATKRGIGRLRLQLFDCVHQWSMAFHSDTDPATLHAAIVQDTERLDIMSNAVVTQLVPAVVLGGCLTLYLGWLNPSLLAATLAVAPLGILINRTMGPRVRRHVTGFHREFEAFSGTMLRQIQGLTLTRLQTAEPVERIRSADHIARLRDSSRRMAWLASAYTQLQGGVGAFAGVIILVLGGRSVIDGMMSLGALASFYVAAGMLASQAAAAVAVIPQLIAGDESLRTICGLVDVQAPSPYHGTQPIAFSGAVALEAVDFSYGGRPVLAQVSLATQPHRTVAIVGPNGAGKSTIAKLVLGWYRPAAGRLTADGRPYDEIDLTDVRRSIAVVPQEPWLLPGSVRDNIAYGQPDMSHTAIVEASELAGAREMIESLPDGYDTVVGERGVRLSGGQRQQIAIARALARRPALLILDEPTIYLDTAAVQQVVRGFGRLPGPPAVLLITHDPALALTADTVHTLGVAAAVSS